MSDVVLECCPGQSRTRCDCHDSTEPCRRPVASARPTIAPSRPRPPGSSGSAPALAVPCRSEPGTAREHERGGQGARQGQRRGTVHRIPGIFSEPLAQADGHSAPAPTDSRPPQRGCTSHGDTSPTNSTTIITNIKQANQLIDLH